LPQAQSVETGSVDVGMPTFRDTSPHWFSLTSSQEQFLVLRLIRSSPGGQMLRINGNPERSVW